MHRARATSSARAVGRIAALADDAFEPEHAFAAENDLAVAGMMIRKLDAVRLGEELAQLGAAIVEPLAPEVHVIHGQEVEAVQEHLASCSRECRRRTSASQSDS
jgi:hypothetical protein